MDPELICTLERHAARAWPATAMRTTADGWLLRATPGLDRGRSNNSLPPCRELAGDEMLRGVEATTAFASEHGIPVGVQVGPLPLHDGLDELLDRRGWSVRMSTLVMATATARLEPDAGDFLTEDHVSDAWLESWAIAEGRDDVAAHRDTVFAAMAGRARFVHLPGEAAGIAVDAGGLTGLFSLAVTPGLRRRGLGTRLVRATAAGRLTYLQVEEGNAGAVALYERMGFSVAYRYRHRQAPVPAQSSE